MAPTTEEKGAGEYGREALSQFREAARYGARALTERKAASASKGTKGAGKSAKNGSPDGKAKLPLPHTGGGAAGELGELADAALARLGKKGKLAAKVGLGHRLVDRLLPDEPDEDEVEDAEVDDAPDAESPAADESDDDEEASDHLFDARTPIPIQESIDVAVPVAAVFDLCSRFEELPRFSERIASVEVEDDTHFEVTLKLGGRQQTLAIEIVGEEPEERLDWDGIEGVEHSGVVTFHPLAPRLTRVELTIEQPEEGMRERLLRRVGLPERSVRQELRRFKAYAELWDEANDYRSADFKDPASEAPPAEDDEPPAEDDEPPTDDEEESPPADEDEPEGDEVEQEPDEEAAPAAQG